MGDVKYYNHITWLIIIAFIINSVILFLLNIPSNENDIEKILGERKTLVVQLFFWSTMGATIACSFFLSEDKEINEIENAKRNSDPKILRYPDIIDVWLYFQRIITSGILGIIGSLILFTGLGFFEVKTEFLTIKHKLFFIIFCFLIGLCQKNFVTYLNSMFKKMLANKQKDE